MLSGKGERAWARAGNPSGLDRHLRCPPRALLQRLDGLRVRAIAPMRQRTFVPVEIAPAAMRHEAPGTNDRHVPHDAGLAATQQIRIEADTLEQPAQQR